MCVNCVSADTIRYSSADYKTVYDLANPFQLWYDELLHWDPDEYDNVTVLVLPANDIWLPEIAMLNRSVTEEEEYKVTDL